jgi:hypothetical protein
MYDGHGSHVTYEMIDAARKSNVILFCLPPHTTHKLQPCDVGAFSPLKRAWEARCDVYLQENGIPLQARDVVQEYMEARSVSFKEETIKQAWRKSGIDTDETGTYPKCNGSIFTKDDFAPSVPSSTRLDLPESYPATSVLHSSDESDLDSLDGSDPDKEGDDDQNSGFSSSDNTCRLRLTIFTPPTDEQLANPNLFEVISSTEPDPPSDPSQSDMATSSDSVADASDDDADTLDLKRRLRKYKQKNKAHQARLVDLGDEIAQAKAHTTLASEHIKTLQGQVNAKQRKQRNDRIIHIGSRVATSDEGLEEARRQKEMREARAQQEVERTQKKEDTQSAVRAERAKVGRGNMVFETSLRSHKLQGLKNILWNLDLDESGTIPILTERIKEHFDAHPALQDDIHYRALFGKRVVKRSAPTVDGNVADAEDNGPTRSTTPPRSPQRRRLASITNTPPQPGPSSRPLSLNQPFLQFGFPASNYTNLQPHPHTLYEHLHANTYSQAYPHNHTHPYPNTYSHTYRPHSRSISHPVPNENHPIVPSPSRTRSISEASGSLHSYGNYFNQS